MITTKTVFILGAGASRPFQYPLGYQLCDQIIKTDYDKNFIGSYLTAINSHNSIQSLTKQIMEFKNKLQLAPINSIDFFLEENQGFMTLGKAIIAENLIKWESNNNIYKSDENWYKYLLNTCMRTTFNNFKNNQVAFLTFNYDRSLEFFLYNFFRYGFSKSDNEVKDLINSFPIVHLYGDIGLLPWQSEDGFEYNNSTDRLRERLKYAIDNIHILYEERDKFFSDAKKIIIESDLICFLGFGYIKENLERLDVQKMAHKTIIGSAYGIETSERNAFLKYFSAANSPNIILGEKEDTILPFLRKMFPRDL